MKIIPNSAIKSLLIVFLLFVGLSQVVRSQDSVTGGTLSVDDSLKIGFDALSRKDYHAARLGFEDALTAFKKKPATSEWLFTKLSLPDENPDDATSPNADIRQITSFRHSMGTRQALLTFAAFTSQLEGNTELAHKYRDQVYGLQGPLWGTSWRIFVPLIQAVFHLTVPTEKSDNFGQYLFLSGQLMWDAHEEKGQRLIEEAQKLLPKDPDIAGRLGSIYMIQQNPVKAKPQSELSLSINPKQPHVLIDLATAEWLLSSFEAASNHAVAASISDPELPGPHLLLSLIALEKGDLKKADEEVMVGLKLSHKHPFYLTIQAAVFEAKGNHTEADKMVKDAWEGNIPSMKQFENWYLKHKALELVSKIVARQKT